MRDREIECTDEELDALAKAIVADLERDMEAEAIAVGGTGGAGEDESTCAWVSRVTQRYGMRGRVAWIFGKDSVVR